MGSSNEQDWKEYCASRPQVTLTPKQALALSSLLGQYQDVLENAINCELIQFVSGKPVDPADPEIRARLKRDRRRWRACEDFQKLLSPGPDAPRP